MRGRFVVALAAIGLALAGGGAAESDDAPDAGVEGAGVQGEVERFTDGDTGHGAQVFKRYCRGCHGADGRGGADTFMPHIANLTKKEYIEFLPDSFLFTVIAEGGEAVGKSAYMPSWKSVLSEQDIKDVIVHIRSLPTY